MINRISSFLQHPYIALIGFIASLITIILFFILIIGSVVTHLRIAEFIFAIIAIVSLSLSWLGLYFRIESFRQAVLKTIIMLQDQLRGELNNTIIPLTKERDQLAESLKIKEEKEKETIEELNKDIEEGEEIKQRLCRIWGKEYIKRDSYPVTEEFLKSVEKERKEKGK